MIYYSQCLQHDFTAHMKYNTTILDLQWYIVTVNNINFLINQGHVQISAVIYSCRLL